jgi:hypothetical protein
MECTDWKPRRQNTLLGFATITHDSGLVIHEIPVNRSGDSIWASPPGKPRLDQDKRHATDLAGKPVWDQIISFKTKEIRDAWSKQVLRAIERAYPGAFL